MGLVTKNAILLVDFTNVQRRAGAGRRDALIEAARRWRGKNPRNAHAENGVLEEVR